MGNKEVEMDTRESMLDVITHTGFATVEDLDDYEVLDSLESEGLVRIGTGSIKCSLK